MNRSLLTALTLAALTVPLATAEHDNGCIPTSADPNTYTVIDLRPIGKGLYYVEERGNPLGTSPPVPLSGFLLGEGTWVYQESNGVEGLQRGSISLTGSCFPRDMIAQETGIYNEAFCLIINEDPINDDNCGHNGDSVIF